jgi:hypothetical protein
MVDLIQFITVICPQQKIDRATAIAWYEVIGDLPFADARAAVISVKHSQAFVDVSDITREVHRARQHPSGKSLAEALAAANYPELPPAEPTPASEEFRTALAELIERAQERDHVAFTAGPDAQAKAAAWIDGAITGVQPVEYPLSGEPAAQWAALPGDPPELRMWLARKRAEAA